jgi:hypothetical protein
MLGSIPKCALSLPLLGQKLFLRTVFLGNCNLSPSFKVRDLDYFLIYRVSQEEMSIFWEVILSKKLYMYMCPIPNGCAVPKLLIRKRYYILFLIPVFIVQVTKLVQFT